MLDSEALVILLTTRPEEVASALEPVEDRSLLLSCADEQHVLAQIVLDEDGLFLEVFEDEEDLKVFHLASNKER